MNVNGTRRIAAQRERVWQALHDPLTLAACVPGCQDLHLLDPGEYEGRLSGQVGTIASTFATRATVSEETYPAGWTVAAHAQSDTAGWFDGVATVTLAEEAGATILGYRARVEAGGRLATLGERLLHGAAVRLAEGFLARFASRLEEEARVARAEGRPVPAPPAAARPVPTSPPPIQPAGVASAPPLPGPPQQLSPQLDRQGGTAVLAVGFVLWLMVLVMLFGLH